ncbi:MULTISPECIES: NIPSNAP family protein [unclassified Achromobacter]|uniref:NIPSNAP family protein n=1 Tax=unclassified Achromobacter TaxID=2626865 RepID=UPI000B51BB61|nr:MULTISPECIES: NIPSNAP family protein [unclassified Achromobacter]OWT71571.1 NIPSNAP family protein [Achromobacter sp. HZ34]OWT73228.1 NIPSNAP family protein [Achromobacter sp. HZ28]
MIFEQRTYTVVHGRMDEYLARYERDALPLQRKYLGRLLGFFVSDIGPLNQVVHIWVYDSLADREQRRQALDDDPAWRAFKVGNRGTFVGQEVKILNPAPFCPIHI